MELKLCHDEKGKRDMIGARDIRRDIEIENRLLRYVAHYVARIKSTTHSYARYIAPRHKYRDRL